MVFVAVGQQEATEAVDAFTQERDIWNDEVDAALFLFGKLDARIDQDDVLATLDGGGVLADLADAAEGNDADGVLIRRERGSTPWCVRS